MLFSILSDSLFLIGVLVFAFIPFSAQFSCQEATLVSLYPIFFFSVFIQTVALVAVVTKAVIFAGLLCSV